jgi:hypothetical protein
MYTRSEEAAMPLARYGVLAGRQELPGLPDGFSPLPSAAPAGI